MHDRFVQLSIYQGINGVVLYRFGQYALQLLLQTYR